MNKTVVIMQSNYIPWRGYFDLMRRADVFVIYDEVQYTKNDWRNRNLLKSPNGPTWLTIPVSLKSLHQTIDETQIANSRWRQKHLKTISQLYRKSCSYDYIFPLLEQTYDELDTTFLSEVNLKLIELIKNLLQIDTRIENSRNIEKAGSATQKLVDLCIDQNATNYLTGPSARNYLDASLFESQSIEIQWMEYPDYGVYEQLHPPFSQTVSIIDLLFNCEPDTYACFYK